MRLILFFFLIFSEVIAQPPLRIENEIKLSVPEELKDSLWSFLQTQFTGGKEWKELKYRFNIYFAIDSFSDIYFDDQQFTLLHKNSCVRHRLRYTISNPESKKNGRELVQLKIENVKQNPLSRVEYKYKVKKIEESVSETDKHPLLGLIKNKQLEEFSQQLVSLGVNVQELKPVLQLNQRRKRLYFSIDSVPFSTITLDLVSANNQQQKIQFTELELELNEKYYTAVDDSTRKIMEEWNEEIKKMILAQFPALKQDQTPKYNKAAMGIGLDLNEPNTTSENTSNYVWYPLIIAGVFIVVLLGFYFLRKIKAKNSLS